MCEHANFELNISKSQDFLFFRRSEPGTLVLNTFNPDRLI